MDDHRVKITCRQNCPIPNGGYCQRHNMYKPAHLVYLCQTRDDYFTLWEKGLQRSYQPTKTAQILGPGTELTKLFARFGIRYRRGCGCKSKAMVMDLMGPEWCRENLETIVNWLQKEAKHRDIPVPPIVLRYLVRLAIRKAKKNDLVLRSNNRT